MKQRPPLHFIGELRERFKASTYWKDIAWLASGMAVAQVITLATLPVFSRLFTPSDFAVQNLFGQIASFMTIVATLRYEYFIQLPKRHRDGLQLIQLVAMLGLLATVLLTPLAWLFRETFARWAGNAALAPWLVFVPVTGMAMSVSVAMQGGAQRRRLFRRSGEAEVVGKVGYACVTLAGWYTLPGAGGLVLGWLGAALGKISWLLRRPLRADSGRLVDLLRLARVYGRMAGSLALSSVFYVSSVAIPSVFIAHAYGSATLGQYALASMAVCLPTVLLGNAIGSVFYQRAAERWARGSNFMDIWRSTVKKLLLIGLPLFSAAVLTLPWLFPLLFGKVWRPAGYFGAILALSSFFAFLTCPMDKACLVVGVWWYTPLWHAVRAATTGMVVGMALLFHWDMDVFIVFFAVQQILLFLIDFFAEWRFAHRQPRQTPPAESMPCVGP
jgi:teichuronic acid exporter